MKESKVLLRVKQNNQLQEIKQLVKLRTYELMFIINHTITEKERNELKDSIINFIRSNNGEIIKVEEWGEKEFSYTIKKMNRGYYILIDFKAYPDDVVRLQNLLRNNEKVVRFMVLRKNLKED